MNTISEIQLSEWKTEAPQAPAVDGEIAYLVANLLTAVGEDPGREGLRKTPERVSRMLVNELLSGYNTDIKTLVNEAVFESSYENMVLVKDIEFYSLCEHHLLPFYGHVQIAYIPNGKIIGLSKMPRLVEMFSRRLQVQERLTQQIAETLEQVIQAKGVAVVIEGAHMCSMMRGVKKSEARMVTRVMLGEFKDNENLRQEFLNSIQRVDKIE
ncbi:MAG: GTP cyclohydrolase I FolE [Omnitrophica WOR_2 bacterium]